MTPARSYGLALLGLAAGGVAMVVSAARPWATVSTQPVAGFALTPTELSGTDLVPAVAAAGWVCLAGIAGVLATRTWGRTAVGAIVVLAGAAAVAVSIVEAARLSGSAQSMTLWWLGAVLGGLLAAASGCWTVARGRRWPAMGARYERARPAAALSAWDALDRGVDPTLDSEDG